MKKQLSPAALIAIKEALVHIYWYKKDFKSFLLNSLPENVNTGNINWELTKREIAFLIIDRLAELHHTEILLKIAQDICQFNSFEHLKYLDDGEDKISKARSAVYHLKALITPYQDEMKSKEEREKRIKEAENKRRDFLNYQAELDNLKQEFYVLLNSEDSQQRGFMLEKLMNRLFLLNDLDPKSSFKITGQQIDGAFSLDGTEFLFEAKWTKSPINSAELAVFKEKVKSKLENTLGLFLSIGGFSEDGLIAFQSSDKVMILMDGLDLISILENRISFIDLILRKKQIAAREGRIFVQFSQMCTN